MVTVYAVFVRVCKTSGPKKTERYKKRMKNETLKIVYRNIRTTGNLSPFLLSLFLDDGTRDVWPLSFSLRAVVQRARWRDLAPPAAGRVSNGVCGPAPRLAAGCAGFRLWGFATPLSSHVGVCVGCVLFYKFLTPQAGRGGELGGTVSRAKSPGRGRMRRAGWTAPRG